jgi:hypothetical protein
MSDLRWPPERFYWSSVDIPGWRGMGPVPPGPRAILADDLPLPESELHAVCASLAGGRVVICAAVRSELEAIEPGVDTLCPSHLPECLGPDARVPDGALNLLVGEYEPVARRRQRLRRHTGDAIVFVTCAALITVGLSRRADNWKLSAMQVRQARAGMIDAVAPGIDPALLTAELARSRRLVEAGSRMEEPIDAAEALAAVLQGWPSSAPSAPQSLAVTGDTAVVSVNVQGDPASFLAALRPPPGWRLDEPRLSASGGTTRLSQVMRRINQGGPP